MKAGKVTLIGAGPGDPGLFTIRGREVLENADVVVYDYLAADELLRYASAQAEKIYVGKKGGQHTLSQEGINELLVEKAREGRSVARLKGGDPFIFGRGGEEAEALVAADIEFEVVPGVTAAVAAAAYAGIPLTHRRLTPAVAFVTGHEDPTKESSTIDWPALAGGIGTLVFYMGVRNLGKICQRLLHYGRDPQTPVALVRWGTTPRQVTLTTALADAAERAAEAGLRAPAIIIVGEVVGLRGRLNWFEKRPLLGRRIVVTRARRQASDLVTRLTALGAECLEFPTIRIEPPEDWGPLDRALQRLDDYDWIVFTSVNGVERFFERLSAGGRDARALGGLRTAVIGPATRRRLSDFGLASDIVPASYRAESVVEAFAGRQIAGARVLLPRAAEARPVLPVELARMGATVDEVHVYRTAPEVGGAERLADLLGDTQIDMVTFTSSSTAKNFKALLPHGGVGGLMQAVTVASIGPVTSDTARSLGFEVHLTAAEYTIPGLVAAIAAHYSA